MSDLNLYETVPQAPFSLEVQKYSRRGYSFSAHWHEHTEIHLILEGSCRLECNGEQIALCAGDCAVINSGELHRGGGGDCVFLCLLLSPAFFENTHILFQRLVRDSFVSSLFPSIEALSAKAELPERLEGRGAVHLLMSHLVRYASLRQMSGSLYTRRLTKLEKINQAITYMDRNYKQPISTAQLAEMLYLSEGYFCQLFKEIMHESAMEYLYRIRTEKAAGLLAGTNMSVSEIAFCCGFSDANYFSRMYKKLRHESPRETRERAEI